MVIGIGLILFSGFLFWERNNPNRLKFSDFNESAVESRFTLNGEGKRPVRISIPQINVDQKIIPAEKTTDKWPTTSEGVSYLTSSPSPGDIGNSIMYGHNWASILKDLPKVAPGQKITVYYDDGSHLDFTIKYTQTVKPTQVDILGNTEDRRITLYTCTGFLDRDRFVVTAIAE